LFSLSGVNQNSTGEFSQANRPSQQWPLTDAEISWEIVTWHYDEFHTVIYSPDVSPIINEILARPGWGTGVEGKFLSLLIDTQVESDSEVNFVGFEDSFGGEGRPAVLELYETIIDTFIGGPVLSKAKSTSISISLFAGATADFYIEFGTSPGDYTQAVGETQTILPAVDPVSGLAAWTSRELKIKNLSQGTRYYYRLRARKAGLGGSYEAGPEYSFMTRRSRGEHFNFSILSDSHIGTLEDPFGVVWDTGVQTLQNALAAAPDFFVVNGDEVCTDGGSLASKSMYDSFVRYARVRHFYGPLANEASIYLVLGNHDGEASYQEYPVPINSYTARQAFFYNPDSETYPFGGGPKENYFAWEWGDALFVCLDIFSYTGPERPKNIEPYGSAWHLGDEQLAWLELVLSYSQARWKFIFAHHILASWEKDGYGRGGAKYAHDWEQGIIHQMMIDYGAQIFFYGHDHAFADGTADGVHYTLCAKGVGVGGPPWASDPYFIDAYPDGFFEEKGHINVAVGPRSVWVDLVRSSLDPELNNDIIFSYHMADVTAALIPPVDLDIPKGSWLSFEAAFTNSTDEIQSYDYWVRLELPSGFDFVYDLQEDQTLNPEETMTVPYSIYIPTYITPGSYTVYAEVGDYPDNVISRDEFGGEIIP
jgi:3',5'-cyclic AMP phosphodiesterase CpdA